MRHRCRWRLRSVPMKHSTPDVHDRASPPLNEEQDHNRRTLDLDKYRSPAGDSHSADTSTALEVLDLEEGRRRALTRPDLAALSSTHLKPVWTPDEATLIAAGLWLRELHEASDAAPLPPNARNADAGDTTLIDTEPLIDTELLSDTGSVRNTVVGEGSPRDVVWRRSPLTWPPEASEVSGLADGDPSKLGHPLRDLGFMALTLVPLTAREVSGDGSEEVVGDEARAVTGAAAGDEAQDAWRGHRLRVLLEAYGWNGGTQAVLAAAREGARQHAVWLRSAAARRYEPAIEAVAEGVAGDFDRTVSELDVAIPRLSASAGTSPIALGPAPAL
jgi:hypothetical protein